MLIDLDNKQVVKIFLPEWLDTDEQGSWFLLNNLLFIWKVEGEKAGLYRIILNNYPSFSDFVRLIEQYNLAHPESSTGKSEIA